MVELLTFEPPQRDAETTRLREDIARQSTTIEHLRHELAEERAARQAAEKQLDRQRRERRQDDPRGGDGGVRFAP